MTDRYERGLEVLRALEPEQRARILDGLRRIAPDLADHMVEFAYGDIYGRPGLDLRTRELLAVVGLAATGAAPDQLMQHLATSLDLGWTAEDLTEALMQIAIHAGFPAAMNGLAALKQVLAERGRPAEEEADA